MLLLILSEYNGVDGPHIEELAIELACSGRQVQRLVKKCEASGDLIVDRKWGRGNRQRYTIPFLPMLEQNRDHGSTATAGSAIDEPCACEVLDITASEKVTLTSPLSDAIDAMVSPFSREAEGKATLMSPIESEKVTPVSPLDGYGFEKGDNLSSLESGKGDTTDTFPPAETAKGDINVTFSETEKGDTVALPHTPYKDYLRNINTLPHPSGSGDGSADAPPVADEKPKRLRSSSKRKPQPSTADSRTAHPAIQACRVVACRYPSLEIYDELIAAIGPEPDIPKLTECRRLHVLLGWNKDAWTWVVDWYVNGIPDWVREKVNSKHGKHKGQPANVQNSTGDQNRTGSGGRVPDDRFKPKVIAGTDI